MTSMMRSVSSSRSGIRDIRPVAHLVSLWNNWQSQISVGTLDLNENICGEVARGSELLLSEVDHHLKAATTSYLWEGVFTCSLHCLYFYHIPIFEMIHYVKTFSSILVFSYHYESGRANTEVYIIVYIQCTHRVYISPPMLFTQVRTYSSIDFIHWIKKMTTFFNTCYMEYYLKI